MGENKVGPGSGICLREMHLQFELCSHTHTVAVREAFEYAHVFAHSPKNACHLEVENPRSGKKESHKFTYGKI